jgi:thiamine-phosphate pyrophosphorylase
MTDQPPSDQPASEAHSLGKLGIIRILDAEANRATEGLRVVEDYVRFVLDDRHLTKLAKELRHDLAAALKPLWQHGRLAARAADADVGAMLAADLAAQRANLSAVVVASFKRAQQGLRSLEEYAKLLDPSVAAAVEPLRYRAYTLERAVDLTATSLDRLVNCRLYVLLDGGASEGDFAQLAERLVAAGVHAVQLRDKKLNDRELLNRGRRLREITRNSSTLFIMNDRPDLAALCNADGVHVGQDELSVKDARAIVGPRTLIGVSTHSIEQARQAVLDGANYIGVGPTFPSATKSFSAFAGLKFVEQVAAEIKLPAFAIGGIKRENLPQVQAAGLNRVAVSGAVTAASDPARAVKELLNRLEIPPGGAPGAK